MVVGGRRKVVKGRRRSSKVVKGRQMVVKGRQRSSKVVKGRPRVLGGAFIVAFLIKKRVVRD